MDNTAETREQGADIGTLFGVDMATVPCCSEPGFEGRGVVCICEPSERIIRAYMDGAAGLPPMPEAARQWCISEVLHCDEGTHTREPLEEMSDSDLAQAVINAWWDYALDKGLIYRLPRVRGDGMGLDKTTRPPGKRDRRPILVRLRMNEWDATNIMAWLKDLRSELPQWLEDGAISKKQYHREKRYIDILIGAIKHAEADGHVPQGEENPNPATSSAEPAGHEIWPQGKTNAQTENRPHRRGTPQAAQIQEKVR